MSLLTLAGLALSGVAAGGLGAILGIGGGVFLIPALVLFFDIPMGTAVATGLVSVIATSSAVASVNVDKGTANWRLGLVLELPMAAGAILGALAAGRIAPRLLIGLFGILMGVFSVLLWRGRRETDRHFQAKAARGLLDARYYDPAEKREVSYRVERLPAGMAVSMAAGSLSGMLGIGGGVFNVPTLHLLCALPMKAASATSNFMIGMTASASAFLYFGRGQVEPVLTASVVLGVLAGAMLGTRANRRLKDAHVKKAFIVLLAVLAVQMLRRAVYGG